MTSFTWTGNAGNGVWATSGNWNPNGVPNSTSDTATIAISNSIFVTGSVTVQTLLNSSGDVETSNGSGVKLLVTNNGSQASENDFLISLGADSSLEIGAGTFKNTHQIDLDGDISPGNVSFLIGNASVNLTGGGIIDLLGGAGQDFISGTGQLSELTNADNTIEGSGTIGSSLDFINGASGLIQTNMGSESGTLDFLGGAGFENDGAIVAGNGGNLLFGQDNTVTSFADNDLIALESGGSTTSLTVAGQVTFNGTGNLDLADEGGSLNVIKSDGRAAELNNFVQIEGVGAIGDANLTLNNFSAIGSTGGTLILNTGANTIVNSDNGTIGASFGGVVEIESPVQNSQGNIAAAELGVTQIFAPISGGVVDVEFDGVVELGAGGSVNNGVEFTGSGGTLRIDTGASQVAGNIAGAVPTDNIDAEFVAYAAGIQAQWQQNGAAGTLSLVNDGTTLTSFALSGQYTTGNFTLQPDGSGGTLIEVVNPPPPAATTADMIMRDGNNGDYESYDLGGNTVQAAYALVQASTAFQVAGLGGFNGADTSDMLLRSGAGAFELYDVSNNNVTLSTSMGQVGMEWSVSGFGDFSGNPGETDMLMRNSNTGAFEVYDISNNAVTDAAPMGQVGTEWQVAGFGDFSAHPGETGDMLMRNSNTGQFELYDISHNQVTFDTGMGQVGLEWRVAGFGDFSGNANETDMLMRNSNTGAFEIYDISSNAIYNSAPIGQVGLEWQVAGFGPIDGAGASDMLMRNSNTGAFEVYDFADNQITNSTSMGQVGIEWSVGGIAADTPVGTGATSAQLMHLMASFAPPGGAADAGPPSIGEAAIAASANGELSNTVRQPAA